MVGNPHHLSDWRYEGGKDLLVRGRLPVIGKEHPSLDLLLPLGDTITHLHHLFFDPKKALIQMTKLLLNPNIKPSLAH